METTLSTAFADGRRRDRDEYRRRGPFPPVTMDQIRQAAVEIGRRPGVQAVYLFGSRARGSVRPSSDIDLAVWVNPPVDDGEQITVADRLSALVEDLLDVPTDVVLLPDPTLPLGLLFDVFSVETILWARDSAKAHDLACRARLEYRDELPRLDRARDRLFARIRGSVHATN